MSSRRTSNRNKPKSSDARINIDDNGENSNHIAEAPPDDISLVDIDQFKAITGSSNDVAESMLKACNGNLQMAVDLFLDDGVSTPAKQSNFSAEGTSISNKDDVRAPIPQKTEVMVESSHNGPTFRFTRKRDANSVFDTLRDFQAETREMEQGGSGFTDKKRTLQELFRPPLDIMFKGSFRSASICAEEKNRWLLVSVQNSQEFSCQVLNRDIWSLYSVKEYIKKKFIFWQGYHDSTDGSQYIQYYHIKQWPHVAILDPRTGEVKLNLSEISTENIMTLLKEFVFDNPSLDPNKEIGDAIINIDDDNILDSSEDKQLMEAIRLSLQDSKGASTSRSIPAASSSSAAAAAAAASASASLVSTQEVYSDEEFDVETFTSDDDSRSSFTQKMLVKKTAPTENVSLKNGASMNGIVGLNGPTVTLQFRFPNGQRKQLTLPKASQLQVLIDNMETCNYSSEKFELITTFPRRKLSEMDPTNTLLDIGLDSQEVIYVQSI